MTALTPRDALDVVQKIRRMLSGYMDAEHLAMDADAKVGLGEAFDEALATLTALVERAGEPVAFTLNVSDEMPKDSILLFGSAAWDAIARGERPPANSYAFVRLATSPTTPGATT